MDNIPCKKVQPVMRKVKKKLVKGELDRLKQAEKKKRRLEKALATSAAIRSELEKKKQKKKEEQQRLNEEGAAVAEAVALHVLLGEDSDDSCKIMLNEEEGFNPWGCASNINLFMGAQGAFLPHENCPSHPLERIGWVSNTYGARCKWDDVENNDLSFSYGQDQHAPFFEDGGWGTTGFSAGIIAAQAVSSLQIAEDANVNTILINKMLGG